MANKTTTKAMAAGVYVRLPHDLLRRLKADAKREQRTLSSHIRYLVIQSLGAQ